MNQVKQMLRAGAGQLRHASELINQITGLKQQAQAMTERAQRMEENRFTVALFGAFSAGKSSFANALMGDMVLPVSPNPTTAAINKIMPPTEVYPHGTVRVVLKSQESIEQDVLRSLAVFGKHAHDLTSGCEAVSSIEVSDIAPNAKPHYTFLKAVIKGLPEIENYLGQELLVDEKEFKKFVAKEEKACFADYIELYYTCPLTEQGMVLVDTPGADSINARHTGVAFEYLKNADVILFVTYYNHAFAQADREFLLQMGRVKDTFELDKMFFIVNAADLAQNDEELQDVLTHVEKNLLSCGIRHPRIYPVSSQTALLAHMHKNGKLTSSSEKIYRQRSGVGESEALPDFHTGLKLSGLDKFEQDFLHFTIDGLAHMAVAAAEGEINRARTILAEFLDLSQQGETVREERRAHLEEERSTVIQRIQAAQISSISRYMEQERVELLYYVKQRLFLRLPELFSQAFNPSVLKDDGRNLKKTAQACMDDLLRFIGYDLAQEMRATSLRLEKVLHKEGNKRVQAWQQDVKETFHGLLLAPYTQQQIETPVVPEKMKEVSVQYFQPALQAFKNPRDFFEGEGKGKMREMLEKLLQEPIDQQLAWGNQILEAVFTKAVEDMWQKEQAKVEEQVDEYVNGLLAALDSNIDIAKLQAVQAELLSISTESAS
ncbi:dynamin family protein [Brevibacillus laterosporus]|uniref:dynamin family protein n=1 Tax=Brevibacillus laterosporus TaxID=1465 RepID=UPI000E6CCC45|nr:dynamin family protein [Brevibacillus laterosporus]AYB41195.1 dynamin family protein [Brevibacillus laterosporus]MBM7108801.1 GTPase Der [Brevibacillus laterosporus]NKQ22242.1 dynamin family protein [Brevibacillus laterosporus]WNX30636.1 dynamin family protein [Brevibacillus laterosporus]